MTEFRDKLIDAREEGISRKKNERCGCVSGVRFGGRARHTKQRYRLKAAENAKTFSAYKVWLGWGKEAADKDRCVPYGVTLPRGRHAFCQTRRLAHTHIGGWLSLLHSTHSGIRALATKPSTRRDSARPTETAPQCTHRPGRGGGEPGPHPDLSNPHLRPGSA